MNFKGEEDVLSFLEHERGLAKAKALVLFDRSGFVKLGSYEIPEKELGEIVDAFCKVASELKELEKDPKKGESFLIGKLRGYLVYFTSVSANMCLLGLFSEDTNFLRLYQSMGVLSDVVKERERELEDILRSKKVEFIDKSEKETAHPRGEYLAPYQVDAILEELKNEIGPASEVIFDVVARDTGVDVKRMTKEQAYEFVNRLADKIGSLERKQKFLKRTYGIIES